MYSCIVYGTLQCEVIYCMIYLTVGKPYDLCMTPDKPLCKEAFQTVNH
jgi:hypothetical protein